MEKSVIHDIVKQERNNNNKGIALLALGCHNKVTQTRWHKQQKLMSHDSRGCKVHTRCQHAGFILRPLLLVSKQLPS